MPVQVKLNSLPESVEEATLMTWYKKEGEAVQREEKIADVETDKVVLEIASEVDGVLAKILKPAGETLVQGDLLAEIEEGATPAAAAPAKEEPAPPPLEPEKGEPVAPSPEPAEEPQPEPAVSGSLSHFSPAARKLAIEHDLDPDTVVGSGRGGRVTKADVMQAIQKSAPAPAPVAAPEAPPSPAPKIESGKPAVDWGDAEVATELDFLDGRPEKRVPMTRLRERVADRLLKVQQTTAMLTTFNEVNMQSVIDIRKRYKETFQKEHGIKLGFMSFFVKAAVEALKRFPAVNASIDDKDVVYHGYFDVGVAMSTERGLMVPILRDADQMSFADVERAIVTFAERAQENKITLEELTGGTFTITNGGVFGSMLSTPILNPPQSAILGMHKIDLRPVVEEGEIVARPIMYLALSYDHRIIDGKEAVSFLVAIKDLIEDPSQLMLNL